MLIHLGTAMNGSFCLRIHPIPCFKTKIIKYKLLNFLSCTIGWCNIYFSLCSLLLCRIYALQAASRILVMFTQKYAPCVIPCVQNYTHSLCSGERKKGLLPTGPILFQRRVSYKPVMRRRKEQSPKYCTSIFQLTVLTVSLLVTTA